MAGGCGCGGPKSYEVVTSDQLAERAQQAEFEQRLAEEMAKNATGEHALPRVVYR